MYARSSFEHSPHRSFRPTLPPQPLLEFHFDSHLHIASLPSTPLPVPYHFRTKSFSFYLTSSKSLARLYQKTPGVRTACSISARSKTIAPTSAKSIPCVSSEPPSPNPFVYVSYEKILRATCTAPLCARFQFGTTHHARTIRTSPFAYPKPLSLLNNPCPFGPLTPPTPHRKLVLSCSAALSFARLLRATSTINACKPRVGVSRMASAVNSLSIPLPNGAR